MTLMIPDWLAQNVAWVIVATGGVAAGTSIGTVVWKAWRRRQWKGTDRRSEDSVLLDFLHRQEDRDLRTEKREDRLTDALLENARAMAGIRGVVENQLVQCREDCGTLHRRVDGILKERRADA